MTTKYAANIAGPSDKEAFAFVQTLALELSAGKIEIPSFPDVAVRVRKVLSDEAANAERVARVVSSEPALVAKLLQVANSVALNPNGHRITELKSAIARIGLAMVRSASLAFALDQLQKAEGLAPLRKPLNELWERGVKVAAMAFVVAKSLTKVNPDSALLAGLMHGMGRVYILTRMVKHPALFADQASYQKIVRDWNGSIAKAVLESWEISPDIVDAVENYEDPDRSHVGAPDLTDVLTVAHLIVSLHVDRNALELQLNDAKASQRMKLDRPACEKLLAETAGELASLRAALGA
jgi:HD-like signal output (HDOD) protein